MSAFMCSDLHLSVLAIYAVRHNLYRCLDNRLEHDPLGREKAALLLLARANIASLDARYPGDKREGVAELSRLDEKARPMLRDLPHVAIIKQCDCYAYQACEHTGWETSEAKRLVDYVREHAIHAMPGYEAAPWGL